MRRLRTRFDAAPLSIGATVAVVLAIVAVVITYQVGRHQQHGRKLPPMASAIVTGVPGSGFPNFSGPPAVSIDEQHAQHIADVLNALPRHPSGKFSCGGASLGDYIVHFVTTTDTKLDAYVSRSGCDGVDVMAGSEDWHWGRWDRDGKAAAAIEAVLPR